MPHGPAADDRAAKRRLAIGRIMALLPPAVALVYVIARAARVGFTHDEAHTFFRFVGAPPSTTVGFGGNADSNNHTLNTLLMTLSRSAFGSSELALRLPNVLAFVGYCGAVLSLLRRYRTLVARLAVMVLLILNPFLLEVFSLARGYGLGLWLMTTSLALLAGALGSGRAPGERGRWLVLGGVAASLSVVANLTFLNFYIPFLIVQLFAGFRLSPAHSASPSAWNPRGRAIAGSAVPAALVAAYSARALSRLWRTQSLYYGGHAGFWSDTVDSLVRCWLYVQPYGAALRTPVIATAAIATAGALLALAGRGDGDERGGRTFARRVAFILTGGVGLAVLQHGLFGTPFPINRTALWILPSFVLLAAFGLDTAASSRSAWIGRLSTAVGAIVVVSGILHLGSAATLRVAILQYHDADTTEMLQDLSTLREGRGIQLLASWELKPSIDYYRSTGPLPWLSVTDAATDAAGHANAAFLSPKDAALAGPMTIWKRYPTTGNVLAVAGPSHPGPPAKP